MNHRKFRTKVPVTCRTGDLPLQSCRLPGVIHSHALACPDTDEEVHKEQNLSSREDESRNRNKHVDDLLIRQELIVQRIVNASHLPADADDVHREEDAVGSDEAHPEMDLARGFIHHPAEHFWEPEIK